MTCDLPLDYAWMLCPFLSIKIISEWTSEWAEKRRTHCFFF